MVNLGKNLQICRHSLIITAMLKMLHFLGAMSMFFAEVGLLAGSILKYDTIAGTWSVLLDINTGTSLSWLWSINLEVFGDDDIYMSGYGSDGKMLYHWNGAALTGVNYPNAYGYAFYKDGINGLHCRASNDIVSVYVGGAGGFPLHAFTSRGTGIGSLKWYEYNGGATGHMNAGWNSDYIIIQQHTSRIWVDSDGKVYIGGGESVSIQGKPSVLILSAANEYSVKNFSTNTSEEEYYPCVFGARDDHVRVVFYDTVAATPGIYSSYWNGKTWSTNELITNSVFVPYGMWGVSNTGHRGFDLTGLSFEVGIRPGPKRIGPTRQV
jgi:hypothetical protein